MAESETRRPQVMELSALVMALLDRFWNGG